MLTQQTIRGYAAGLAAGEPTPGGGSAAALVGALAAALGEMAGNFTVGRARFARVDADVRRIIDSLELHREKLLVLTDADADAYSSVGAAYGMVHTTAPEKTARKAAIEQALKAAARVPLAVTESCLAIIDELAELREKGNPNLVSDVAVAAELALGALRCAWLNVEVNLAAITDAAFVATHRELIEERLARAEPAARAVFDAIAADIRARSGT